MKNGQKKNVTVLMPVELYEELNRLAEDASRSMSSYIRQVLKAHLQYMDRFRKF